MAELADALDSGSNGRKAVQVQVLSPAPKPSVFLGKLVVFSMRESIIMKVSADALDSLSDA